MSEFDGSPAVSFVQIRHTAHGGAVLLQGDNVYPGTVDGGVWTFKWEDRSLAAESETHDAGYTFDDEEEDTTTVTFRFERDGEDASGKVDATTMSRDSSAETDEWDAVDVGLSSGQIRANILDMDSGGGAVRNGSGDDDCQGNTCELTVTTTCSSSSKFTAVRTNHADDDYEYLADVGQ